MTKRALNCAETFQRLDDYVDRELAAEEIAAVEAHLEQCATCAEEFAVESELLACIRERLRRLRVPPDLRAKISARLGRT